MGKKEKGKIPRKRAKYIVDAVVIVAIAIADAIIIVVFVLSFAAFLVSQLFIFCVEATGRNEQQNKTKQNDFDKIAALSRVLLSSQFASFY